MKKYWFRPKCFGYGFCPISWEGWFATLVLVGFVFLSAHVRLDFFTSEVEVKDGFSFLCDILIFSIIFTLVFRDKVRGGLQWRWSCEKK